MTPTGYFLDHLWMIPLFPLATAALMLFVGKRLPKAGVSVFCVGSVGLSFIYALGADHSCWPLIRSIASPSKSCLSG